MRFIFNSDLVSKKINKIKTNLSDTFSLMKKISIIMKSSVMKNFQEQGTDKEKWKPLSSMTLERRRKGKGKGSAKILMDTGFLRNSIFPTVFKNKAILGTNVPYASTHQFGAKKGEFGTVLALIKAYKRRDKNGRKTIMVREHKRRINVPFGDIPARPFMNLREEDKKRIVDLIKNSFYGN